MSDSRGLQFGHASSLGRVRETNEDSYLVMTPPSVSRPVDGLIVVADGVGGSNAGEVASGVLVQAFRTWFANNSYQDVVHYNQSHPDYFVAALKDLLELSNQKLYKMAGDNASLANMGTTATVALFSDGTVTIGHVGDTRAYLLRGQQIQQLTNDHTWVADEVAAGRMSAAEAADHPKGHVISRVLGTSLVLRVERRAYPVSSGDMIVLTSDGLTGLVSDLEILGTVDQARTLQDAANQLVELANQRGGGDNITIVVCRVGEPGQPVNGLGPQGVALNSVYLGQLTNGSVAKVPPAPASAPVSTSTERRSWLGLLVLLAPLLTSFALGYGMFTTIGKEATPVILDVAIPYPLLVGVVTGAAVWFGFLLGYLAHQMVRRAD